MCTELRSRNAILKKYAMAAGDLRIPGEGVLIGDKLYSGVTLTLDNCRVPAERLQSSPSADHGLTSVAEEQLRMRGCELIQAAGILLKLPQVGEKIRKSRAYGCFHVHPIGHRVRSRVHFKV